ncbi:MAG: OmpA family protein [Pseudomonadota bacterium]
MIRWSVVVVSVALAACARTLPAPDLVAFDRLLAEQYDALSQAEFAENDWADGRFFRRKRDMALSGQRPEPDDLADRTYPDALREELEDARNMLLGILGSVAALIEPRALAEAQGAFDCWAQEAEEGLQPDEIEECRARFFDRLRIASSAATAPVVVLLPSDDQSSIVVEADGTDTLLTDTFASAAVADGTLSDTGVLEEGAVREALSATLSAEPRKQRLYLIYFQTGGTDITPASEEQLQAALADARETLAVRVTVFGHTDRVGSASLNVRLALARAEAMRERLIAAGVPAGSISADSFGESFPLVATPDNIAEPLNRRVEIAVR